MINVVWLKPIPLDHFMLQDMFNGDMWNAVGNLEFNIVDKFSEVNDDGAVVVLPGAYYDAEEVNTWIAEYKWVLLIVVSDEENLFQIDKIDHPNMKLWIQTPRADKQYPEGTRFIGVGYAFSKSYRSKYEAEYLAKKDDVFISAQNTHPRRSLVFRKLHKYSTDRPELSMQIFETQGFTQGMESEDYYRHMASSKVVPCPSGIFSPDSFRLYEALEFGCVPIADDVSPAESYDSSGYWKRIFPDAPFHTLKNSNVAGALTLSLNGFNNNCNKVFSWWMLQKRQYVYNLTDDIRSLANKPAEVKSLKEKVTIIVPVSPWKSHPDTSILEATVASIRHHFPESEIIITFDGVRKEQVDRKDDYYKFIRRMLWKINTEYSNVLPLFFSDHAHQTKMAREALKYVRTESVIYVEGDSPLYTDRAIDWDGITNLISQGDANIVRLYNKEEIPEVHEYLMHREHNIKDNGAEYVATSQWSQQPHIARADTYRYLLSEYFTKNAVCFIEDKIYYVIVNEIKDGLWDKWKMFIYLPEDKLPRSYHLDGREGEEKYDGKQIW